MNVSITNVFTVLTTALLLGSALAAVPNNTLVYQTSADIPTLDPAYAYDTSSGQVVENVYETLVGYKGADLKTFTPLLATSWTISPDNKTYTFTLRKNVKFHTGNDFSCADAQYSFRRDLVINNPDSGNWFLADPLLGTQSNANDDKSVTWDKIAAAVSCNAQGQLVFKLVKVDPAFLGKMAAYNMSVVDSKHAVQIGDWDGTEKTWKDWVGKDTSDGVLSRSPSGTGAYKILKTDPNQVLAQAFPDYWGKKGAIQNIVIQKVQEQATRLEAFKRGDADLIDIEGRPTLSQLQGAPGITIMDGLPNNSAGAFFMNENIKDPGVIGSGKLDGKGVPANFFGDVNVRKAFSYAFDYKTFIAQVQQGKGMQRSMLLPDIFPGYDAKVPKYSFNPTLAAGYFKKAFGGQLWTQGFTFTADYRAGSIPVQTAMELLKKNIEALNPRFHLNLQSKQWSQMLSDSRGSKEAMIVIAWVPDYVDPDNFMYTFYSSQGYYEPRSNFKDAQIDGWLEQARQTTNTATRNALYSKVGNRAYALAPYILYPAGVGFLAYRSNLTGVTKSSYNPMRNFYTGTLWNELAKK